MGGCFLEHTADSGDNGYKVAAGVALQMVDDVTTMVAAILRFEWMSTVVSMVEINSELVLRVGQCVGHQLGVEGPD